MVEFDLYNMETHCPIIHGSPRTTKEKPGCRLLGPGIMGYETQVSCPSLSGPTKGKTETGDGRVRVFGLTRLSKVVLVVGVGVSVLFSSHPSLI